MSKPTLLFNSFDEYFEDFLELKTIKWKVRVLHTKKPFNSL